MNISSLPMSAADFLGPAPVQPDDWRREIRLGAIIAGTFATFFVGWAAFTPLGAAASAPGVVKVTGERKAVQSLTGGVISGLLVNEGSTVRAGQTLVRFAAADALAEEQSLKQRVIGLQAEIARLEAQRVGGSTVVAPAAFAGLRGEDRAAADRALAAEQQGLEAIRRVASARHAALNQRIAQIDGQLSGYGIKRHSIDRQRMLNSQELTGIEELARKGFATKTRVLSLRRTDAGLEGERGSLTSDMASLNNAKGEARMQSLEMDNDLIEQAEKRLREAQSELQMVLPQWQAAREKLARTDIRAPVSGQVVGLSIHTVGGVASPGQILMEVVPTDRSLTVEANIAVTDINEVTTGQMARVRINGLHGRQIPVLHGKVVRISADSMTNERTGMSYYTASVHVPRSELDSVSKAAGISRGIRPGTPVEVQISLHDRTALGYWLDPLRQLFSGSLHER